MSASFVLHLTHWVWSFGFDYIFDLTSRERRIAIGKTVSKTTQSKQRLIVHWPKF